MKALGASFWFFLTIYNFEVIYNKDKRDSYHQYFLKEEKEKKKEKQTTFWAIKTHLKKKRERKEVTIFCQHEKV